MWNDLEMEIGICNKCILERTRKNAIPGKGNKQSKILFIMDNISEDEDVKGDLLLDKNLLILFQFQSFKSSPNSL